MLGYDHHLSFESKFGKKVTEIHNICSRCLGNELDGWMRDALSANGGRLAGPPVRAVIVPHAGYRYCGACAGHSYSQIDPTVVRYIILYYFYQLFVAPVAFRTLE
jgi:AmmeMemoRadiSam system protein B